MAYERTGSDPLSTSDPSPNAEERLGFVEEGEATARQAAASAVRKAQRARTRAAAGLDSAAKTLHAGVERAAGAGHSAGDALASSARYMREHDVRDMIEDAVDIVRSYPGVALVSAAALGFLVGRAITRAR